MQLIESFPPDDIECGWTTSHDGARWALNARDAMPDGGTLSIKAFRTNGYGGFHCVTCGQVVEGSWICIAVHDSGIGIPQKDLPYIFEPFYTTKEPGKGTGLGLAQVYGIAKSHEGHVNVQSVIGGGAHFLDFPAWIAQSAT